MKVRTRFAPSPTGYLHVGGIRTALFAWLLARQKNGQFILRIEDTDKNREVKDSDKHIISCLQALGLDYDEGPGKQGSFGPYHQSQRLDIYKRWAQKLIDNGRAYADPYTPEQVQQFRQAAVKNKQPFLYRNHRPEEPPVWDGSQPLRFKSDPKAYHWQDAVMGDMSTGPEVVDDFILIKSDGYPTYNFAHIVDDAEMQISHVIRGQEFLASQPNYLNLYEALGLDRPVLATMPHIMAPAGNKKLSKRDGAKDVLDYIEQGYMPEVLVNFIASMGWNDGSEQELFTIAELIDKFSLERVQRSGARFDEQRLSWMNGARIRQMTAEELYQRASDFLPTSAQAFDQPYKIKVIQLSQERLKYFSELEELTNFFFEEPSLKDVANLLQDPSNKQIRKISDEDKKRLLTQTLDSLSQSSFEESDIQQRLNQLLTDLGTKPGILFSLIRIAVSGAPASPQLFPTLATLGKPTTIKRIEQAISSLS